MLSQKHGETYQHHVCIVWLKLMPHGMNDTSCELPPAIKCLLITVAARSTTWTVFTHSKTAIMSLNPIQGMDVSVRLFWVCVVLCVSSSLATG
jgi:hypothetical protein